ncbi:nucleotidyltransferase family protein [Candidatus Sumerlaeota bacterium]|nr:nucleotidyltransferase family protein [Candidatus Sumerlaeota bacterium]
MDSLFHEIDNSLKKHNISMILIGGHAMQAYGIVRQTLDVDLLAMDKDVPKIKDIMKLNGYNLLGETENFLRFHNPESTMMDIDILLVDPSTFEMLYDSGSSFDANFGKWRIPSPAHFIALKIHAVKNNPHRETRDVADIVDILRKTGSEISTENLRRICEKYGPEGIYEKIRKFVS